MDDRFMEPGRAIFFHYFACAMLAQHFFGIIITSVLIVLLSEFTTR